VVKHAGNIRLRQGDIHACAKSVTA